MRVCILRFNFNSFIIPRSRLFIFLHQLIVHSDVIVRALVRWTLLNTFFVPFDCALVIFFCSTVTDSHLVCNSCVFRVSFAGLFQFLNFLVDFLSASGNYEICVRVFWHQFQYFLSILARFRWVCSFVLISHCN
jgi:hypothetical protein